MKHLILYFTLSAVLLVSAWAQRPVCPPSEVLWPCTCAETSIICRNITGPFPIKEIFDNASESVDTNFTYANLYIYYTELEEIPEGAVNLFNFDTIYIGFNSNLTFVHPMAFNTSRTVTKNLYVYTNAIGTKEPLDGGIFQLANNFPNLESFGAFDNELTSIPENAFGPLVHLRQINLRLNKISRIGSNAFSQLENLRGLYLSENRLPSSGLDKDAFRGPNEIGYVDIACNFWTMGYLEQGSYQALLDRSGLIYVSSDGCLSLLYCKDRADWICDRYDEQKISSIEYRCEFGYPYRDISDYCRNGRNGTLSQSV